MPLESYHNDIKYHMALNTIFSVEILIATAHGFLAIVES